MSAAVAGPVRRALLAIAVALVACSSFALASGEARTKAKPTCFPRHTKTYKANETARVYTRHETIAGTGGLTATVLYGCHLKTKRPVRLAVIGLYDPDHYSVTLQGRYVAVNYTASDRADQAYGSLRVWDLRRAKRLHSVKDVGAEDMEIGPGGSVAWIGSPLVSLGDPEQPLRVRIIDGQGDRTVATGGIAPRSLALSGSTLYWTQDGAPRSAQMTP